MYKEWLEREIYNHLVCFCEEDADFKTTPVFVEVPVATAAQEVKELRYVGLDAASEGSVTITPMAIYTYTGEADAPQSAPAAHRRCRTARLFP